MRHPILAIATFASTILAAPLAAQTVRPGTVLPIRDVVLSDGSHRYGVTITLNGRPMEVGLDSGSTGLRVMARALPGVGAGTQAVRYGYGSGTRLVGSEVSVQVGFVPGAEAPTPVQKVDIVDCLPDKPRCPAVRNHDPATFGIQGDGLPNQGFVAIMGVAINAEPIPNPLQTAGAKRWIIELPQPGGAPGRLILNPTDEQVAGFTKLQLSVKGSTFPACITLPGAGRICGPATVDSGAPGLRVVTERPLASVGRGSDVTLTMGDGTDAPTIAVRSNSGPGTQLNLQQKAGAEGPHLFFGTLPYFRLAVLYDADAHMIGFKPR